jgi:predicted dehydrogenase
MTAKLRVGIIGANAEGSWGSYAHLPALAALDGLEATAVATSRQSTADATAAKFGLRHAFGDPRRLVEHPDVDIVSICVRVPAHRDLVLLALAAGKHVYCEWPLGRETGEAEELLLAAKAKGVVHMVGLQARSSPVLAYVRDLIADGAIGTVRSAGLTHSTDWITHPYPSMTYLQDRSTGAHFLSIPGGHSIDALCWLLGEFETLAAFVKTVRPEVQVVGTGETIARSSADQIVVSGELAGGALAALRFSGGSSEGTGVRLEISGDSGDLVVTGGPGDRGIQMADLRLRKTVGIGAFEDVAVPERYFAVPPAIRRGPPLNVGEAYLRLAAAIGGKSGATPDFQDAVSRHRTLDRVEQAARAGNRS